MVLIHKYYRSQHLDMISKGKVHQVVCDFIDDANGNMYFLNIVCFTITELNPDFLREWKLSTRYSAAVDT